MRGSALFIIGLLLISETVNSNSFEAQCGPNRFRVNVENRGHPLGNRFELIALSSAGPNRLFVADDGGWFHVACLPNGNGEPMLVFQSYCGGSACVEDRYGLLEPRSLKLLLDPGKKNVGNAAAASKLLGKPVPSLLRHKEAFCCEK